MATVINTYAKAFADVVFDSRLDAGKTLQQTQSLAALVAASKQLREVWHSPAISPEQKRAVLDAIVARMGIEIMLPTALTRPPTRVERLLHWQEGHSFHRWI